MCGLSAIFGKNSQEFSKIKRMTDLLHHRGPDNKGIGLIHFDEKNDQSIFYLNEKPLGLLT